MGRARRATAAPFTEKSMDCISAICGEGFFFFSLPPRPPHLPTPPPHTRLHGEKKKNVSSEVDSKEAAAERRPFCVKSPCCCAPVWSVCGPTTQEVWNPGVAPSCFQFQTAISHHFLPPQSTKQLERAGLALGFARVVHPRSHSGFTAASSGRSDAAPGLRLLSPN